jgi:hypothetical protein
MKRVRAGHRCRPTFPQSAAIVPWHSAKWQRFPAVQRALRHRFLVGDWHSRVTQQRRMTLAHIVGRCARPRACSTECAVPVPRWLCDTAAPILERMTRHAVFAASVVLCGALTACGASHYVQRGADLYCEGRYVEADEVFEHSEPRVARAPIEERAAYAAYRGATFVALGDLRHAQHWLGIATELERAHPGALRAEERLFLDGAWRALTNRLPTTPPAPASTAIASSSQAPSPSVDSAPVNAPPTIPEHTLVPQ